MALDWPWEWDLLPSVIKALDSSSSQRSCAKRKQRTSENSGDVEGSEAEGRNLKSPHQNQNQKQNSFSKLSKKRKTLLKNLILMWSPGCVYWNNLRSIIKTMFYHFPSRLVTSYKLDHLTHLSCTWNSDWNPALSCPNFPTEKFWSLLCLTPPV